MSNMSWIIQIIQIIQIKDLPALKDLDMNWKPDDLSGVFTDRASDSIGTW